MNRLFDQHCSKDKDAKCGRCIEGYTKPKFSVQPCVIDTVHIPLTTTNNPRTLHMPLEVTVNEMNTTLSFNYMPKSQIIIEVVLMITSVLTLGIIFVIYRIIRRLHCYLNDDLVLVSTSEKAESTTTPCNQKQEGPVLSTPLFENLHKVHNHEECNDKDGGGNYDSEPIQKVASSNNGSIYVVVQKGDNNNIVFNTADDQMPS